MKASITTVRDPFNPWQHRECRTVGRRRKLRALAPRTQQPFICLVNGAPQLRNTWNRRVKDGDMVAFVVLPQGGGGGSNPLNMILQLAVFAFAPELGIALAGEMGVTSAIGIGLVKFGVGIVGSMLVNTLLPPPKPPAAAGAHDLAAASPTYSVQAQGNQARINQPLPVIYGTMRVYPDFAAMPYTEYNGNDQYLYQLLLIGQGEYTVSDIRIEDTSVSTFSEITYEVVAPGASVSLFPANVTTSGLVSGQEATNGTPIGPFPANAPTTTVNAIGIDIVCPRGLYYANDGGGLDNRTVTWTVEARLINDLGVAIGSYFTLGSETLTQATTTPVRKSYRYTVSAGRYEVRLTRTNAKDTSSRAAHELDWAALRGYLPGAQAYGQCTLLAVRMLASNNLSAQASRKLNALVTRKLPIWNGTTWSANTATNSIAWAFADACKASYGGKLADARIDLAQLLALDTTWAARGDQFNGVFDAAGTVWEALTIIARCGRAQPYLQGGIVHLFRDQAVTLPVALFSGRNIVKGSFKLDYAMASEQSPDAVDVSYFDSAIWSWRTVRATLPSGTSAQPAQIKAVGITSRAQAWREGMYMAACNRYRRRHLSFSTEMEGFIPSLGDLIAVSHDMPQWGQYGDVVGWDASSKTLTLAEPLTWPGSGTCYLAMRSRSGAVAGPWVATIGADNYHVVIASWNGSIDPTPDTDGSRENTHYAFGAGSALYVTARVLGIKPQSELRVDISAVVESAAVHSADSTGAPSAAPAWQLPIYNTAPVVTGLTAVPMLYNPANVVISWQPAAGADHYLIELSADGVAWTRCGDTSANAFTTVALYGEATRVRVCAAGMVRGPWTTLGSAIGASAPALITGLVAEQAFVGTTAMIKWNATPGADSYSVSVYTGATLLRTVPNLTATRFAYSYEDARADLGLFRSLTFLVGAVCGTTASTAASITLTNPQIGAPAGLTAITAGSSVAVSATLPTDSDYLGCKIWLSNTSGFNPATTTPAYEGPSNGATFPVAAGTWYYRLAFYDVFDQTGMTISTEGAITVTGSSGGIGVVGSLPGTGTLGQVVYLTTNAKLYRWDGLSWQSWVDGSDILAASVTAGKISVASLGAINANLGNISAGAITLDSSSYFRGGQSAYDTGAGFWMGYSGGAYKFSIGNSGGNKLTWDGSNLNINGGGTFSGALSAATGTFAGTLTAGAVNAVDTINIAGNAVTVMNAVTQASNINITGAGTQTADIISYTFSSSGGMGLFSVSPYICGTSAGINTLLSVCWAQGIQTGGGATATAQLILNGTAIYTWPSITYSTNAGQFALVTPTTINASLLSGTNTVIIRLTASGSNAATNVKSNAGLVVVINEYKR